ncbi:MAG: molecular chaperone DnaK, partial [Gammaproteobacteria bacterium]|nr:molecular chaperone DnaK [Gammaproteobacteria bacterium]
MAIIGIDLGTSNSAAAVLRGGRPVIIPSAEGISLGGKAFPSYIALTAGGQMLVGEPARRQMAANPEGTVTAFKRKMGQRVTLRLRNREYTPEQLSAFLLQKIKRDAEAFLGETVAQVVVTVPAYFDDNQRSATKDACKIAGLDVVRLVNEPTAAALAYGLDRAGQELRIAVIDFGGGTLDVTVMEFGNGVFEVKATSGDTQLGGTDMDRCVLEYLLERFRTLSGVDLRNERMGLARLKEATEIAKIELTANMTTHIALPYIAVQAGAPVHLDMEFTRAELERQVAPVIERCRAPVQQALADARFTPQDIDRIVFVGGPTRMPSVRRFFEALVERKAEMGVDPMECVAAGAAIQAGVLAGESGLGDIVLVDVTPLTLGVETLGGVATALITRNTPIPVKHSETFTTAADLQTGVTIHVYQGERAMAKDNVSLGEFNLGGIPPAPRGVPKIDVTFDIDANGILNVTAKDQATTKSASITISGSTRLAEGEKERMVNEAERFAEDDKKRREEVQKLNEADMICYEAEKMLAEFSTKLS